MGYSKFRNMFKTDDEIEVIVARMIRCRDGNREDYRPWDELWLWLHIQPVSEDIITLTTFFKHCKDTYGYDTKGLSRINELINMYDSYDSYITYYDRKPPKGSAEDLIDTQCLAFVKKQGKDCNWGRCCQLLFLHSCSGLLMAGH